jgi:mRNA interferase RelE/StbE
MRLRAGDWRVIYTADLVVLLVVKVAPRGAAYD